jgi:general secretion pathway protein K
MRPIKAKTVRKDSQGERRGFVVVVVLCMVILLGILLFGFNYKTRADLLAVDDLRKSEQALNCARAGLNIAIAAIRDTEDIYTNRKLQNLLSGEETLYVGEGSCSITVTEENGKLNINLLKGKDGGLNRTRIDQLLRLIDLLNRERLGDSHISYGLVPSIIDWIDSDDEVTCLPFIKHENSGAESDYYSNLTPPYRCRNNSLETTEELLLVKGITPQVFGCLRDYVTVRGDEKININWASKRVIQSLSQSMDPALAQMIIERRKFKSFGGIMELRDIPGMTDSIYQAFKKTVTVSPTKQYYRVRSQGTVDGLSCTTVAILARNMKTKNVDVILYKEL